MEGVKSNFIDFQETENSNVLKLRNDVKKMTFKEDKLS